MILASKEEARKLQKAGLLSLDSRESKEKIVKNNLYIFLRHSSVTKLVKTISYIADDYEISPFPSRLNWAFENLEFELYFPKVTNSGLEFFSGDRFEKGELGMMEPVGGKKLLPEAADWIIVPALGWNGEGARLGRGKGFYDRTLKQIPAEKMIGLSFEELYPCDFSEEAHDLRVGQVITEKKNHCFPKKMGEKSVP